MSVFVEPFTTGTKDMALRGWPRFLPYELRRGCAG